MIYLLIPHDTQAPIRIFRNFALAEQVLRRQEGDWCTVFGYTNDLDECTPIWIWYKGKEGNHVYRDEVIRSPSESSHQRQ
jgi:hypothetical protein